jgi:signal transduction histidine kinase
VEISVSDNGIGFEKGSLERILQPFQRLHNRNEYQGSGIGLTICQKIIERHGGVISASSTPGEGSTFYVRLPLRQPDDHQTE